MKGIVFTLSVIFIVSTILLFYAISSNLDPSLSETYTFNSIQDRIFYKFKSIERAVEKILKEEASYGSVNVTIIEGAFNLVTFQENLPTNETSGFGQDIDNLKKFIDEKFNETNLIVDLNLTDIKKCLPLTIEPYGITYTHPDRPNCLQGQEEIKINPNPSLNLLNSYTTVFKLGNANLTSDPTFGGPGCSGGNLVWNVTVMGDSSTFGPTIRNVQSDKMCKLNIAATCNPTAFKATIKEGSAPDGTMIVELQPNCNITSTTTLNLTLTSGKVSVVLSPKSIKIKETVFNFEKNDTVYIE